MREPSLGRVLCNAHDLRAKRRGQLDEYPRTLGTPSVVEGRTAARDRVDCQSGVLLDLEGRGEPGVMPMIAAGVGEVDGKYRLAMSARMAYRGGWVRSPRTRRDPEVR